MNQSYAEYIFLKVVKKTNFERELIGTLRLNLLSSKSLPPDIWYYKCDFLMSGS